MELHLSHIAGDRNDEADALSRWDFTSPPPFNHDICNRMAISLQDLWVYRHNVSLHPADTYLLVQCRDLICFRFTFISTAGIQH